MSATSIINTIDEMLKNDATFDTRAGLRFMAELVKDAFEFIDEERTKNTVETGKLDSFSFRISNVEQGLHDFLELRKKEQERAEDERKYWRRLMIGSMVTILISQAMQWILK